MSRLKFDLTSRARPRGHPRRLVAVALLAAASGVVEAQTGRLTGTDLTYLGAFRLECGDEACSYNLTDRGSAPSGGLWVTDHVYDYSVRRIGVPAEPLVSEVFAELPQAPTYPEPELPAEHPSAVARDRWRAARSRGPGRPEGAREAGRSAWTSASTVRRWSAAIADARTPEIAMSIESSGLLQLREVPSIGGVFRTSESS